MKIFSSKKGMDKLKSCKEKYTNDVELGRDVAATTMIGRVKQKRMKKSIATCYSRLWKKNLRW